MKIKTIEISVTAVFILAGGYALLTGNEKWAAILVGIYGGGALMRLYLEKKLKETGKI